MALYETYLTEKDINTIYEKHKKRRLKLTADMLIEEKISGKDAEDIIRRIKDSSPTPQYTLDDLRLKHSVDDKIYTDIMDAIKTHKSIIIRGKNNAP